MRAVIFSGGHVDETFRFTPLEGDYIICADNGIAHARALGVKPQMLIGDFDSIFGEYNDIPKKVFKREKDETDTRLAVDHALELGYMNILIIGALGGRADHSLANIFLLEYIWSRGGQGILEDGQNRLKLTDKPTKLAKEEGAYVSLLPMFGDVTGVTLSGMKYPLDNYHMKMGDAIGISNEVTADEGFVAFKKGLLLIIASRR